jgi:hypothetical protein
MNYTTKSVGQSFAWGGDISSSSQEIRHILWNLNVHYHLYLSTPPASSLSQINLVNVFHRLMNITVSILEWT